MICYLFTEPTYFFFTSGVPALLYYAYIPTTIVVLFVGIYVFWSGRQFLLNRLLLAISLSFSLWTTSILIEWTNIHSDFILLVWSFQGLIFSLIAMFSVYFIYVFLDKKDVSARIKTIFLVLLTPVLFLVPTSFNLGGFDITNCDAFKFESIPFKLYYTSLGVLAMIWILILLIRRYRTALPDFKKQIVLMGTGIEFFLFLFFIWTSLTYYLTGIGVLPDSRLEMYGMFGIVAFVVYISILMVRFHAFNAKLIATQALVWGLAILIGSQFFFIKITINYYLTGITLIGAIIFGQILVDLVKKEIKQKEELQDLLKQRESLVHLITHKVKSSFTHSKYIFDGLLGGMYGQISPEVQKIAKYGLESDNAGIHIVDLVLNASNLQKGTVKYDLKPFDFKKLVLDLVGEKEEVIKEKGLELIKEIDENNQFIVNGDAYWLKEVVNNLVENSFRYTPQGKIIVGLKKTPARNASHSDAGGDHKVLFYVKDTGIGISDDDKKHLFTEGGRGAESVKINVDSTGYGLYSVKLILDGHKGRIWAESDGPGKGSTFFVELNTV